MRKGGEDSTGRTCSIGNSARDADRRVDASPYPTQKVTRCSNKPKVDEEGRKSTCLKEK